MTRRHVSILLGLSLAVPALGQDPPPPLPPDPPPVMVEEPMPEGLAMIGLLGPLMMQGGGLGPFEKMILLRMVGADEEMAFFMTMFADKPIVPVVVRHGAELIVVEHGIVYKVDTATHQRTGKLAYRSAGGADLLERVKAAMAEAKENPAAMLALLPELGALDAGQRAEVMQALEIDGEEAMMMAIMPSQSSPPAASIDGDVLSIVEHGRVYTIDLNAMAVTNVMSYADAPDPAMLEAMQRFAQMAQRQAAHDQATANLKQLGMGAIMYAQDHDEVLPGEDWVTELAPYVGNPEIFRSPAWPDQELGYVLNDALVGLAMAEIPNPTRTVLFFESPHAAEVPTGSADEVPDEGPHHGSLGVGFADGHVELLPPERVRELLMQWP